MKPSAYHRPERLEDALALGAEPGARYLAGGTDLLVGAGPAPEVLVSLRAIPDLEGLAALPEGGMRIGALTTVGALLRDGELAGRYPVLAAAARRLGSVQIRNQATVGGNLCRAAPCADLAPPLIVHEASLELAGPAGRREVSVQDFFRGPGVTVLGERELLVAVRLPPPRPDAVGLFLKKGRVYMDLSLASVALLLEQAQGACTRVRLAAGSVAPTPLRLEEVEALLEGQPLTDARIAEAGRRAGQAVLPITDVRATAGYRRRIVEVYVRRALARAREEGAR